MAELDDDDTDDADMVMRLGFNATIVQIMPALNQQVVLWGRKGKVPFTKSAPKQTPEESPWLSTCP
jgi:hypothetical protein